MRYKGNERTCSNCHETSMKCVGGGIAKNCRFNYGKKLHLNDHMQRLWNEIGYTPSSFKLQNNEASNNDDHENVGDDCAIEKAPFFAPTQVRPPPSSPDRARLNAAIIKNLPPDINTETLVTTLREFEIFSQGDSEKPKQ